MYVACVRPFSHPFQLESQTSGVQAGAWKAGASVWCLRTFHHPHEERQAQNLKVKLARRYFYPVDLLANCCFTLSCRGGSAKCASSNPARQLAQERFRTPSMLSEGSSWAVSFVVNIHQSSVQPPASSSSSHDYVMTDVPCMRVRGCVHMP